LWRDLQTQRHNNHALLTTRHLIGFIKLVNKLVCPGAQCALREAIISNNPRITETVAESFFSSLKKERIKKRI